MFRRTQDPDRARGVVTYRAVTFCGGSFQILLLTHLVPCFSPTTPTCKHVGLASSLFARRYLGNRYCFLFLQLLRCFSSLRVPSTKLCIHLIDNIRSRMLGSPIRKSPDHCLLTAPRSISAFVPSFFGS